MSISHTHTKHTHAQHLLWCTKPSNHTLDACRCRVQTYIICAVVAFIVFVVELYGSRIAQSAGLHADAFHVISDVGMIGIALFAAVWVQYKHMLDKLSGIALILIGTWLAYGAAERMIDQQWVVSPSVLFVVALFGLAANVFMYTMLGRVRDVHAHEHTSHHSALLHVLGDLLGSCAIAVTAVLLMALPEVAIINYLDPLCGIGIGIWLAYHGFQTLRGNAHVH